MMTSFCKEATITGVNRIVSTLRQHKTKRENKTREENNIMKLRKILALLLSCALVLILVACGNSEAGTPNNDGAATTVYTIQYGHNQREDSPQGW